MSESQPPGVLAALWKYRWMSVAIILGVTFLSTAAGLLIAPPAQATATIALKTPSPTSVLASGLQGDASLGRYTAQRARFVTSDAVVESVAEQLGRDDITTLRHEITAVPAATSNTITITTSAPSAAEAVELAAAVVDAVGTETAAQIAELTQAAVASIDSTIEEVEATQGPNASSESRTAAAATISQLLVEKSEILRSSALLDDGIEFAVAPRAEAVVEAGLPIREVALGLVLGLTLAATAAWLRADRERGITAALDAEPILDAPLLGQLHAASDVILPGQIRLRSLPSHDYRVVWSALLRRAPAGVLLVNSPSEQPRVMATLNLAVAAARENLSVLLVDADIERGTLSQTLDGGTSEGGVRDLFTRGGDYTTLVHSIDLGGGGNPRPEDDWDDGLGWGVPGRQSLGLDFLPSGRLTSAEINITTHAADYYVAEWRKDYDIVLIDAAPIGYGQLASVLSGAVDGVLVVVNKGEDSAQLQEVRRWVRLQATPVVGYVYASDDRRPWREFARTSAG
jgi:capsular polysaccharide biosynthesis protein